MSEEAADSDSVRSRIPEKRTLVELLFSGEPGGGGTLGCSSLGTFLLLSLLSGWNVVNRGSLG